jgi:hypothetical protein
MLQVKKTVGPGPHWHWHAAASCASRLDSFLGVAHGLYMTRSVAGNVPYKGQNGVFLQLPHGWELAPSDADSIGVCGANAGSTLNLF